MGKGSVVPHAAAREAGGGCRMLLPSPYAVAGRVLSAQMPPLPGTCVSPIPKTVPTFLG